MAVGCGGGEPPATTPAGRPEADVVKASTTTTVAAASAEPAPAKSVEQPAQPPPPRPAPAVELETGGDLVAFSGSRWKDEWHRQLEVEMRATRLPATG